MSARTDVHRPGAILPVDYRWVLSYELSRVDNGWPVPSFGVNCELDRAKRDDKGRVTQPGVHNPNLRCCLVGLRQSGAVFAFGEEAGGGKCDVCGAWFASGDVWRHEPTGEHVHLGHTCVDKYSLPLPDRSAWQRWHKAQAALRAQARKEERLKTAALRFCEGKPGLAEALRLDHPILKDMASRLRQWGSLSEKQQAFALKLAEEVRNPPPPKAEEAHVPAPEGRVTVLGRVVSTREMDSDFGPTLKMVVKVETPEGSWLVWTTAPSSLLGDRALKGSVVSFKATLTRGRDAHFAFGKRPTNAVFVEEVR